MGWVRYRLRSDLRARVTAMLAVALLIALVSATLLTVVAGARRTSTAVDRLAVAGREPHAFIDATNADPAKWDRIGTLPSVARAGHLAFVFAFPPDGSYHPLLASVDGVAGRDLALGRVVAGRRARPTAADEVAVAEHMARELDLRVGHRLELISFTPETAARSEEDEGAFDEPDGPSISLKVVGIIRTSQDVAAKQGDLSVTLLPPAFFQRYRGQVGMGEGQFMAELRDGPAGAVALSRELRALFAGGPAPEVDASGVGTSQLQASVDVLAAGLLVFAGVAALFGLAALGQALSRTAARREAEQLALAALGAGRRGRLLDGWLPAVVAAAVGVLAGAAIAVAASPLLPFGLAGELEPDPGVHADWLVLAGGGGVLLVVAALMGAWSAWRIAARPLGDAESGTAPAGPVSLTGRLARLGRPSAAVGVGMVGRRGRGAREIAVRTALAGVVLGVAGLAASTIFGSSMTRLVDSPERWGWRWDASLAGGVEADALARRPDVDAVAEALFNETVDVNDQPAYAMALAPVKGRIDLPVTRGRPPTSDDEVALGAALYERLGRPDRVEVRDAAGRAREFRVVGTAVYPSVGDPVSMSGGAVFTATGIRAFGALDDEASGLSRSGFNQVVVRFRPGVPVAATAEAIAGEDEFELPAAPAEVTKLDQVSSLPGVLVLFLVTLAVLAVGHALTQTVQRRRMELGVLRAIGFTRGQVAAAMGWQAGALAVTGVVIGLPLGIGLGRWSWALAIDSLGVATDSRIPPVAPLAALVAIVLAVLAGFVLGRLASRRTAAVALRTE